MPPAATPAEDSTKVVTVDVPSTEPVQVAIASAIIALFIFGTSSSPLSFFTSRSPLRQAPYSVPRVSNISTIQNARAVVINRIISPPTECPSALKYAEKSKPSVNTFPNDSEANAEKGFKGLKERVSAKPL